MQIEEQDCHAIGTSSHESTEVANVLFEPLEPMSFPERFPRLTCGFVAFALMASALVAEIDCLSGLGYFWR
jgi:hypothetical protein